jgi:hypothetical protein
MSAENTELIIPDYAPYNHKLYPGDIKPGSYTEPQVKNLLKKHKDDPDALQLLRDMLEECDDYKYYR